MTATETARVVIIGGGAVGVSSLYHLAKAGWTDCVLAGEERIDGWVDMACRRQRPDLFHQLVDHEHAAVFDRALSRALGQTVDYPMNYHVTGSIRLGHIPTRGCKSSSGPSGMGRSIRVWIMEHSGAR